MPRLSVIVPTYNSGAYIRKTISGILAQDYQDYEIIVVDDASTDDTEAIVRSFDSARIQYIKLSHNHGGPSRARNIGLLNSQGEYIAFFDSDDLMLPGRLNSAVVLLDSCPEVGMTFTDAIKFDTNTGEDYPHNFLKFYDRFEALKTSPLSDKAFFIESKKAFNCLFFENYILTCGVTARRNVFDSVGPFDESLTNGDDRDMWFRITEKFNIAFIDDVSFRYRVRAGSISDRSAILAVNRIRVLRKRLESELDEQSRAQAHRLIASNYACIGYSFLNTGEIQLARQNYLLSLKEHFDWHVAVRALVTFLGLGGVNFLRTVKAKLSCKNNDG
jgi:glycosyltransferase involved in cell wall biosynthesis